MNHKPSIEERLADLANELNTRPSIADRVAEDVKRHGRQSLLEIPRRHRFGVRARWSIGIAGTGAAIALLVLTILTSATSVSFAHVKSALANIRTVIVSRTFAEHPGMRQRLLASIYHDTYRSEHVNGSVCVHSRDGKTLLLNTKDKTGQVTPGAGFGRAGEMLSPMDYLKSLQTIEVTAVRRLGKKDFDGRLLIGFELPPLHGAERTVWIDPDTKLPVREEVATIGNIPGTDEGFAAYRMPASVATYEFNGDIADNAFSMSPPGYTIVDFREYQTLPHERKPLPDGLDPGELVITPGKGLGPVSFGMSQKQVIAIFGEPDHTLALGDLTEIEETSLEEVRSRAEFEKMDVYERNREIQSVLSSQPQRLIKRDGVRLHYYALGIDVAIDDDDGVTALQCFAKTVAFGDFAGKFENGISMASSAEDTKCIFGKPSREYSGAGHSGMFFADLGVGFTFNETGAVIQIDLFASDAK